MSGCIEWWGNKNAHGYGRLWRRANDGRRELVYAHRPPPTSIDTTRGGTP